jgi:hypothetical protein
MKHRVRAGTLAVICIITGSLVISTSSWGAPGLVVKNPKDGFTFSLPPPWKQVPLSGNDIAYFLKEASKGNANLEKTMTTQVEEAIKAGIRTFAVGPIAGNFLSNISVIVESSKGAPSGNAFYTAAQAQLQVALVADGFTDLKLKVVHLPLGKALQATYDLTNKSLRVTTAGLQLYILHKSHVFIVTISTHSHSLDKTLLKRVGDSWRWT